MVGHNGSTRYITELTITVTAYPVMRFILTLVVAACLAHPRSTISTRTVPFPGLLAERDWFVQTILTNDAQYLTPGYLSCDTGGANGWCLQAWQYSGSQPSGVGPSMVVSEGDQLEITYQYNPSAGTMQQTTVLGQTGQVLLDYTIGCGPGYSLSFDIECHSSIDQVPQHTYTNTKIQLSSPNPSFNTTLHTANSSPTGFTSTDGGTNWFIKEITLLATSCECYDYCHSF